MKQVVEQFIAIAECSGYLLSGYQTPLWPVFRNQWVTDEFPVNL
jgi:hypothetical protein